MKLKIFMRDAFDHKKLDLKVTSSKLTNSNYFLGGATFQFGNISSLWSKSYNASKLFFDNQIQPIFIETEPNDFSLN